MNIDWLIDELYIDSHDGPSESEIFNSWVKIPHMHCKQNTIEFWEFQLIFLSELGCYLFKSSRLTPATFYGGQWSGQGVAGVGDVRGLVRRLLEKPGAPRRG